MVSLFYMHILVWEESCFTQLPETQQITLSRAGRSTVYPANFQLAMATNPCPCGCYGSHDKICLDSAKSIDLYWKKFSAPLLDRVEIKTFADMIAALQNRHDFFASKGCKLSDHGIEEFYDEPYTDAEIDAILDKALSGKAVSVEEQRKYKHAFLKEMAIMDYEAGWTQQFHYGAIRDNNTAMYNQLGPDTGFDSIGEFNTAKAMSKFLNRLATNDKLTKTIIYNLNPADNEVVATMLGNFQDGTCPGKIQWGSGWWFLDQEDGMKKQINALSALGLLSRFVGMLTDSRSFLSYPRHEYFRRILCNILGEDLKNGKLPKSEMAFIHQMVKDISYNNAERYFNF